MKRRASNNSGDVSKLLYWGRFAFRSNANITWYHQIERKYHHIIWLHPGPIYCLHQLEMQNCNIWFHGTHGTIDMWIYPLKVAYFTEKLECSSHLICISPRAVESCDLNNGFIALGSEAPLRSSWSRWAWIQHLALWLNRPTGEVFTGFLECGYISYIHLCTSLTNLYKLITYEKDGYFENHPFDSLDVHIGL